MSFLGKSTIYGAEGDHETPYLTRLWIGRLRLHIFYRGDEDPDCHDHPWWFITFPLVGYREEVLIRTATGVPIGVRIRDVKPWRFHFRSATHTHRVLSGKGKIITIVYRGHIERRWGFLKKREGIWCWVFWKDYIFHGGKHAPCEPESKPRREMQYYESLRD